MNLFGVGPTEVFLVLIVILVLFGPDKLPEVAKKIGGASRELRGSLDNITEQMNQALESSMEADKARMTPPAAAQPSSTNNPPRIMPPTPTDSNASSTTPPAPDTSAEPDASIVVTPDTPANAPVPDEPHSQA